MLSKSIFMLFCLLLHTLQKFYYFCNCIGIHFSAIYWKRSIVSLFGFVFLINEQRKHTNFISFNVSFLVSHFGNFCKKTALTKNNEMTKPWKIDETGFERKQVTGPNAINWNSNFWWRNRWEDSCEDPSGNFQIALQTNRLSNNVSFIIIHNYHIFWFIFFHFCQNEKDL